MDKKQIRKSLHHLQFTESMQNDMLANDLPEAWELKAQTESAASVLDTTSQETEESKAQSSKKKKEYAIRKSLHQLNISQADQEDLLQSDIPELWEIKASQASNNENSELDGYNSKMSAVYVSVVDSNASKAKKGLRNYEIRKSLHQLNIPREDQEDLLEADIPELWEIKAQEQSNQDATNTFTGGQRSDVRKSLKLLETDLQEAWETKVASAASTNSVMVDTTDSNDGNSSATSSPRKKKSIFKKMLSLGSSRSNSGGFSVDDYEIERVIMVNPVKIGVTLPPRTVEQQQQDKRATNHDDNNSDEDEDQEANQLEANLQTSATTSSSTGAVTANRRKSVSRKSMRRVMQAMHSQSNSQQIDHQRDNDSNSSNVDSSTPCTTTTVNAATAIDADIPAPVATFQTSDGRRLSVSSTTPGAPAPPPPPASASVTAAFEVVSPTDGRRLSVKAVTPGAPLPPPPPLMQPSTPTSTAKYSPLELDTPPTETMSAVAEAAFSSADGQRVSTMAVTPGAPVPPPPPTTPVTPTVVNDTVDNKQAPPPPPRPTINQHDGRPLPPVPTPPRRASFVPAITSLTADSDNEQADSDNNDDDDDDDETVEESAQKASNSILKLQRRLSNTARDAVPIESDISSITLGESRLI